MVIAGGWNSLSPYLAMDTSSGAAIGGVFEKMARKLIFTIKIHFPHINYQTPIGGSENNKGGSENNNRGF